MRKALAATVLALFGLAPGLGSAECGGHDAAASAAATPPSELAATPAPVATKAPTTTASKAPVKPAKQAADKSKEAAPDAKVAAVSIK